jgi:hypothetical protein
MSRRLNPDAPPFFPSRRLNPEATPFVPARTQKVTKKVGSLSNLNVGDEVVLDGGATAVVTTGIRVDNALNRRLNQVGQTYKKLKIIRSAGGPGVNPNISRARRNIDLSQAQRAFNTYWSARVRAAGTKQEKDAVKRLMAKDRAYSYKDPKRTTTTSRYNRKSAGRLDYPGVDDGPKRFKGPSAIALQKLQAYREFAKTAAPKGRYGTRTERNNSLKQGWMKQKSSGLTSDFIEQEDNLAMARAMPGVQLGGRYW